MKQNILIVIFTLSILLSFGQKEHLEPAPDFSQYKGVLKEYYDDMFPKLYTGFSQKPYARYTTTPAFSKQYAFSVEKIKGKYYVLSNKFSENFWYAETRSRVALISNKTQINRIMYVKIGELFHLLAEQTRNREELLFDGDDGITYYFATTNTDGQVVSGKTWSPHKESLLGRLVAVCDQLFSLTEQGENPQEAVFKEIEELIAAFSE